MRDKLEVQMKDNLMRGIEAVILEGHMIYDYQNAYDKSRFLAKLEKVSFTEPYPISERWV